MTDNNNFVAYAVEADKGRSARRAGQGDLLPADVSMDSVTLYVADFERMIGYYRDALSLNELQRTGNVAVLGRNTPLIVLRHEPSLPTSAPHQAGLFHTALLFPTKSALAATVLSAAQHKDSRFTGSADHLVSEAFYFTDPEGNGIELYWDRPRELWNYDGAHVRMAVDPLDPGRFLDENLSDDAIASATVTSAGVGHVHLQVGDTRLARDFYVDTLGFETTAEMPGALFVSAGGYHHHMAMNTWNSRGAGPRAASLGLGQVSINVPSRDDVDSLLVRLRHHDIAVKDDGAAISFGDPWNNLIEVSPLDS